MATCSSYGNLECKNDAIFTTDASRYYQWCKVCFEKWWEGTLERCPKWEIEDCLKAYSKDAGGRYVKNRLEKCMLEYIINGPKNDE